MTVIPLSLYIHIPWCIKKCPYCDFNSHQIKQDADTAAFAVDEERYISALIADLESELPNIWGRSIESIFIGGGTPSLFSARAIEQLLSGIRQRLKVRPNIEITLEANPGTFEQQRFSEYREAGINRLSIGIQSFQEQQLQALGRVHDGEESLHAAETTTKAGFENFNLDIMFGLPQQSIEDALQDLRSAINCQPMHISWYQLTIEENTLFHHAPPILPNDDLIWEMQQQGQALLQASNYTQYEVSTYAKPNRECQHNLNYWQFGDYLGIGAGAHGKLTFPDGRIERHSKYRHPNKYIETALCGSPRSSQNNVTERELLFEFILNSSRLKSGFDQNLFEERTLLDFSTIENSLEKLIEDGLMQKIGNQYSATTKGWAFVNDIAGRFI